MRWGISIGDEIKTFGSLHLVFARATTLWIGWVNALCMPWFFTSKTKNMQIPLRNATVLHIRPMYINPVASPLPHFQGHHYFKIGLLAAFRLSFSRSLFSPFFQKIRRICVISLTSDVVILVLLHQFVTPEMLKDFTQDCSPKRGKET